MTECFSCQGVRAWDTVPPWVLRAIEEHQHRDFEVGKHYLVPTVDMRTTFVGRFVVYGLPHDDPELLRCIRCGSTTQHAHLDLRFLTRKQADYFFGSRWGVSSYLGSIIHQTAHVETFRMVRRRCLHPGGWPIHPSPLLPVWDSLHRPLPACRTCPHRGLKVPAEPDAFGLLRCPGHGLAWHQDGSKATLEEAYPPGLPAALDEQNLSC